MESTVITKFNYKGHDVRFAFDEDEAYIFVEDGEKLEHLFIKRDPALTFKPVACKRITVNEPGKEPKEHLVASAHRAKLFGECEHYPKANEFFYFYLWLWGVVCQAHREYVYLRQDHGERYYAPEFRQELLQNAKRAKDHAENRIEIEQFIIDELSKSQDEEVTFTFIKPEMKHPATPPSGRDTAEAIVVPPGA